MTTSLSYSFTVAQTDIVREAMLNVGAIGESEVPTAQEYTDCARKLNMLVKQWMGRMDFAPGLKMWTRQRATLFLGATIHTYNLGPSGDNWAAGVTGGKTGQTHATTQTTAAAASGSSTISVNSTKLINNGDFIGVVYNTTTFGNDIFWTTVNGAPSGGIVTLTAPLTFNVSSGAQVYSYTSKGQRPLSIVTCILRDINANDIPLNFMTIEEYEALPSKVNSQNVSDPSAIYYESQIGTQLQGNSNTGNGQLYIDVYGAQDVTKFLHIVYLRPVQDMLNPGDNPEYPQQWYRPLCWGLSREICGMFDAVWTRDMDDNYRESMAMAKEADSETTSFYFQVNATSPFDP